MDKKQQSFIELKRKVYLVILPCILISLLLTLFVQIYDQNIGLHFYTNVMFIIAFIMGWYVVYFKRWKNAFELVILSLLFIFYWFAVYMTIHRHINTVEEHGFGSFLIWLPLIHIYTFAVLKRKTAIRASLILLVATILPAIYHFNKLNLDFLESLIQLYIATLVYIVVLVFAFKLFRTQAEIDLMRQQLYLDPLTQIGNRHQIDEWMVSFIGQAKENQLSLVFFDIDRFKFINDRFGHKTGDSVLRELTQIVQNEIKEKHYFGRWGGEEFIIVLHDSECEAYLLAERIREVIGSFKFSKIGHVTASFGVTGFVKGDTPETILDRADERLYQSKNGGRNRVTGKL